MAMSVSWPAYRRRRSRRAVAERTGSQLQSQLSGCIRPSSIEMTIKTFISGNIGIAKPGSKILLMVLVFVCCRWLFKKIEREK